MSKDCRWLVTVSPQTRHGFELGEKKKTWILTTLSLLHSHDLAPDPMAYIIHQKRDPKYLEARSLATLQPTVLECH